MSTTAGWGAEIDKVVPELFTVKLLVDANDAEYGPHNELLGDIIQFVLALGPRIVTVTEFWEREIPVGTQEYKVTERIALNDEIESDTVRVKLYSPLADPDAMTPWELLTETHAGAPFSEYDRSTSESEGRIDKVTNLKVAAVSATNSTA